MLVEEEVKEKPTVPNLGLGAKKGFNLDLSKAKA